MNQDVNLVSKALGPLPIINRFLERLRLDRFLNQFVPCDDRRLKLAPAVGLGLLLRNVLVARQPLYGLSDWAHRFDESVLGLPPGGESLLNDDRVGRCLDSLFRANRAALMTAVVVHAVRTFDVDLTELHNDSTTVTFTGQYAAAQGGSVNGQPTHRITFGHNKDHRPDLKQLVWILTTSGDGSVPVWCSLDHGNSTDDKAHIETWDTLRRVVGKVDFLYVADSKLCTKENMEHIAREHGRFLTILPKTRREDGFFRDWLQTHKADWVELLRKKNSRRKAAPDEVHRGFESPLRSVEGYRVLWIWSSQKHELDRGIRQGRIHQALQELEHLRARMNSPRTRVRTREQAEKAAAAILAKTEADRWIATEITTVEEHLYTQASAGRPSNNTQYVRQTKERFHLNWHSKAETLQYDDRTDGIFPLILNDDKLSLRDALLAYKQQPSVEKRHEQLKTVFEVMPVNLKSHSRIEAFLFVYFLALLVESLVEREIRVSMKTEKASSLPLYPEGRPYKAPTAHRQPHLRALRGRSPTPAHRSGWLRPEALLRRPHRTATDRAPPARRVTRRVLLRGREGSHGWLTGRTKLPGYQVRDVRKVGYDCGTWTYYAPVYTNCTNEVGCFPHAIAKVTDSLSGSQENFTLVLETDLSSDPMTLINAGCLDGSTATNGYNDFQTTVPAAYCNASSCPGPGTGCGSGTSCGTDCDCGECWACQSGKCVYDGVGPYGCYGGCSE